MTFIFLLLFRRLKNLLGIFLYLVQNRSFSKLISRFKSGNSNFIELIIFLSSFILSVNFLFVTPVFDTAEIFDIINSNNLSSYFDNNFGGSIPYLNNNNNDDFRFLRLGSIFSVSEISIIYLLIISIIFSLFRRFIYFIYILEWESSIF